MGMHAPHVGPCPEPAQQPEQLAPPAAHCDTRVAQRAIVVRKPADEERIEHTQRAERERGRNAQREHARRRAREHTHERAERRARVRVKVCSSARMVAVWACRPASASLRLSGSDEAGLSAPPSLSASLRSLQCPVRAVSVLLASRILWPIHCTLFTLKGCLYSFPISGRTIFQPLQSFLSLASVRPSFARARSHRFGRGVLNSKLNTNSVCMGPVAILPG
jgi:hypothetical protein